ELARLAATFPARRFLDMGTGTGYAAIYLAQRGFEADAVDNNPRAIENARRNMELNGVKVGLVHSSLYGSVKGPYDVVLFNPPRIPNENIFTRTAGGFLRKHDWFLKILLPLTQMIFGDERAKFIVSFIRQSRPHLSPQGRLLMHLTVQEIPLIEKKIPEINIQRLKSLNFNQGAIVAVTWK
ncbi:MAG: class I SAM-dependent methyltransferase, partial [Deltaproteobacteria bacterium]|nr:class I SAM-dependent methyltransferase [Deltaproteobacteria bacterium]